MTFTELVLWGIFELLIIFIKNCGVGKDSVEVIQDLHDVINDKRKEIMYNAS